MTNEPRVAIENGSAIVYISGAATIDAAAQIHQCFLEALDSQCPVVLDASGLTECDVSFVQLVASLCSALAKVGRTLESHNHAQIQIVQQVAAHIGFQHHHECIRKNSTDCLLAKLCSGTQSMETGKQ